MWKTEVRSLALLHDVVRTPHIVRAMKHEISSNSTSLPRPRRSSSTFQKKMRPSD